MPSKSRKHSKTPVTPSYSNQSIASKTLMPSTSHSESEVSEGHIDTLLEEASIRFPLLISKDALTGRIVDVESKSGSHAAKIWLSESAMVASRLTTGSIVSVSLPSSKSNLFSSSPLDLLVDKSSAHYGFEVSDKRSNEAGNYFALAVVYPSCKVLKDGVRLSQSLLSTMGNPFPKKIIFISPIGSHPIPLNGIDKLRHPTNKSDSCLSIFNCRDLYLELDPLRNVIKINSDMLCSNSSTTEAHHDNLQNGNVSSPNTPLLYESNISSPDVIHARKCEGSGFNERHAVGALSNTYDIVEALGNEKSRGLLQICASLCLRDRLLLRGNLVVIKMFGQDFKFVVNGANTLSAECPSEDISSTAKYVTCRQDNQTHDVDCTDVAYIIDFNTRVHLSSSLLPEGSNLPAMEPECAVSTDKKADRTTKLGGLSKEYAILKEVVMSSSVAGPLSSLGLRSIKGVLLHGPPGTGKTCLARSCVNDTGFKLFSINGPEIISQFLGESEQALCDVFDSASKAAPAVVFIDELDAIAPARKDGGDELSQRMVATLLNLMDGIRTDGIIVIAATNRPDSIDPALRRPGRLDREIEIGVPSPKQRFDILQTLLEEIDHSLIDSQVQHLASSTHGFVGADLAALCNEAALACLRHHIKLKGSCDTSVVAVESVQRKTPCIDCYNCSEDIMGGSALSSNHVASVFSHSDSTVSSETVQSFDFNSERQEGVDRFHNANHFQSEEVTSESGQESLLKVCVSDFEKAKMKVRPSAMREVILEIPKVSWEDVGGQEEVKKQLIEAVEWPQKHQDSFKRIGTRPPTGVLMFGPPGCSKTLMARAVASEAGLNFLSVKGPELFSKWVGESEKAVKSLFAKARANAPSIIFFDEIDGLAIIRGKENDGISVSDRVMSQLLVELDGLHQRVDVTVIAATNRPDKIDPALLRPGRFDRLLYVGPPNEDDRLDIFRIHLLKMLCSSDVVTRDLARLTDGCTGADISLICREAALAAIEESVDAAEISMAHFMIGLRRVQPSEVRSYEEFSTKFQRNVCSGPRRDEVGRYLSSSSCSSITFRNWLNLSC